MKMICLVSPTDYNQRIYIFEGDKQVTSYTCAGMSAFYKNMFAMADEYEIKDIDFEGLNVTFLEGVRRIVKSQEKLRYNNRDMLNITVKEFIPDITIEEN